MRIGKMVARSCELILTWGAIILGLSIAQRWRFKTTACYFYVTHLIENRNLEAWPYLSPK